MRHVILYSILILFTSSATADWLQIQDFVGKGRDIKVFVDTETISRHGDRVTMWSLINYAGAIEVGEKEHISSKELNEYDCKDRQYRILALYWYSDRDAEGEMIYDDTAPGPMKPIIEDSVYDRAMEIACGKM